MKRQDQLALAERHRRAAEVYGVDRDGSRLCEADFIIRCPAAFQARAERAVDAIIADLNRN